MKNLKWFSQYRAWLMVFLLALTMIPVKTFGDGGQPPFDFSDSFYRQNGINPSNILGRVNGTDGSSVVDHTTDPTRRDIRVFGTTGGFDASGNLLYYNIFGMVMPSTFTSDDAGRRAISIANQFRAFIFPKKSGDPLSPAPSNRRQDNLFDTRDGYFSNNPLGLWVLTFVSYTSKALNTVEGQKQLNDLAAKNGRDLDGTPVIKTASDVDNLAQNGFVLLQTRALSGSQGFPWVI